MKKRQQVNGRRQVSLFRAQGLKRQSLFVLRGEGWLSELDHWPSHAGVRVVPRATTYLVT